MTLEMASGELCSTILPPCQFAFATLAIYQLMLGFLKHTTRFLLQGHAWFPSSFLSLT